jgi:hypothetical protein
MNPGPEHHQAADQVLNYLQGSTALDLQLGGEDSFVVSSDVSFADNFLDRKSSQTGDRVDVNHGGRAPCLVIGSEAAKESFFVSRLLKELDIKLHHRIKIL